MSLLSFVTAASNAVFLSFIAGVPLYGFFKKVKVYEVFIDGAKEGFQLIIRIVPYLVAMLVALGMFRASGAIDLIAQYLSPILNYIGMPPDVLPLALIRPFSGSAAIGTMADIIHTHGGNSYISQLAATMMSSTETTFYVIAVYFGAVAVTRTRHAIPVGLAADFVGILASLWICKIILT